MGIKTFFKRETGTIDGLVQRWQDVQQEKAALTERSADLKKRALSEDIKNLGAELAQIRLELELAEAAELEIKSKMKELLTAEMERDYQQLPQLKEKYQQALDALLHEAGKSLAHTVSLLQLTGLAPLGTVASAMQAAYSALCLSSSAEAYAAFQTGFNTAKPATVAMDFATERRRLRQIEERAPGSVGAQAVIVGRIARLLDLRNPVNPAYITTKGL